ncbi:hypothetical protein [Roseimaritima ulvae]|uniref:Uncharacterized protein n=1 Tax=Roseimaritima ulvae TaxID=980254 RepID=A0A5B9QWE3_9BACT|nr:hypothetical protein [Roseimaritima ulvae]QEG42302.1 hypothetical protein UC8_43360 [Roseimaritima ulvae]
MKRWIERLLLIAVVVIVAVLTVTAVPVLGGGHLGGTWLLAHMAASGALVFVLPVFAIVGLWREIQDQATSPLQRWGFWAVVLSGLLTIATVFVCMLPLPSTSAMETLIVSHGYAGWALAVATIGLLIGCWRRRSKA